MKCPKCPGELAPMGTSEGVVLDFCPSCSGILFDQGEVAEYFALSEDFPDIGAALKLARRTAVKCPKCGADWVEMPYADKDGLLVDLCTGCGAVWTDAGEFHKLQKLASSADSPKSRLLRAARSIESKGFTIIGIQKKS